MTSLVLALLVVYVVLAAVRVIGTMLARAVGLALLVAIAIALFRLLQGT